LGLFVLQSLAGRVESTVNSILGSRATELTHWSCAKGTATIIHPIVWAHVRSSPGLCCILPFDT